MVAAKDHYKILAAELRRLVWEPVFADTHLVCADGSLRLNRFHAALILHAVLGLDSSAMQDIAVTASLAAEDLTIVLPGFDVVSIKSLWTEGWTEPCLPLVNVSCVVSALKQTATRRSVIRLAGKQTTAATRDFRCPICEFCSSSRGNLSQHVNSLHGKIRYQCSCCPFSTSTAINLSRHVRTVHEGVRLSCDSCAYNASSRAKMKHHRQTHHEGLRFPCHVCAFRGTTVSSLKRHVRTSHEGVRHPCPRCERQFSSRQHLKVHMESVHEGLRHNCPKCTYVATTRGHLRSHGKRVHSIE
jgi:hypothetical protein